MTSRRIAFCSSAPEAIKVESQSTRAKLQKLPPVKAQLPPVLASWSTDQSFFLPASELQILHATREPLAVASRVDRLLHPVQAPRQKSMTGSVFILTVFYGPRRVVLANLPAAQSPKAMCGAMRDGAVREGTPEGLGRLGQLSPGISASLQNPPRGLGFRSYSMQATRLRSPPQLQRCEKSSHPCYPISLACHLPAASSPLSGKEGGGSGACLCYSDGGLLDLQTSDACSLEPPCSNPNCVVLRDKMNAPLQISADQPVCLIA